MPILPTSNTSQLISPPNHSNSNRNTPSVANNAAYQAGLEAGRVAAFNERGQTSTQRSDNRFGHNFPRDEQALSQLSKKQLFETIVLDLIAKDNPKTMKTVFEDPKLYNKFTDKDLYCLGIRFLDAALDISSTRVLCSRLTDEQLQEIGTFHLVEFKDKFPEAASKIINEHKIDKYCPAEKLCEVLLDIFIFLKKPENAQQQSPQNPKEKAIAKAKELLTWGINPSKIQAVLELSEQEMNSLQRY